MTTKDRRQEDRALEALIVWALRLDLSEPTEWPDLSGPEPTLSPEDERAQEALGDDFIQRLLDGTYEPRPRRKTGGPPQRFGWGDEGLTDRAREEMERKVRELEAARGEGGPP